MWSNPSGLPSSASFSLPAPLLLLQDLASTRSRSKVTGFKRYQLSVPLCRVPPRHLSVLPCRCTCGSGWRNGHVCGCRGRLARAWAPGSRLADGTLGTSGVFVAIGREEQRPIETKIAHDSELPGPGRPLPPRPSPPALAARARESFVCASSLPAAHCLPLRCRFRFPCHLDPVLPSSSCP